MRTAAALALLAGLAGVAWLSLTAGGEASPAVAASGWWNLRTPDHPWDKLVHAVVYAGFMALVTAMAPHGRRWQWGGGAALFLFGVVIEVMQGTIPGRTASVADALANLAGIVVGALAARRVLGAARGG